MFPAYSLIKLKPGYSHSVVAELNKIIGVVEVTPVTGRYDLVVKIQGDMIIDAVQVAILAIRKIDGVLSTETLLGCPLEPPTEPEKRTKSYLFNF